jgi:hypothetical protein
MHESKQRKSGQFSGADPDWFPDDWNTCSNLSGKYDLARVFLRDWSVVNKKPNYVVISSPCKKGVVIVQRVQDHGTKFCCYGLYTTLDEFQANPTRCLYINPSWADNKVYLASAVLEALVQVGTF